ncbi:MAG: hypothetical protein H7256_01010 [Bdellovibrio sp.]|nr:hypothetical protein [Bdellovibrio sp.]
MFHNLKSTTIRLSKSLNFAVLVAVTLIISSCVIVPRSPEGPRPLTEREVLYEKGNALLMAHEYAKAEVLFLSLTGQHMQKPDAPYDMSLWNLSTIYDKNGFAERSILILLPLLDSEYVSQFKIKAALMKNYFLLGNSTEALKYKKMLDAENPKMTVAANALYYDLVETLDLNYDHLLLEELQYVGEIQKYLIFVMEQNESKKNEKVTELLTSIYDAAYAMLAKDSVNPEFKKKIAISLLNNLRRFELLKLNDLNINQKTVSKFTLYADKKQKQITDWLHQ